MPRPKKVQEPCVLCGVEVDLDAKSCRACGAALVKLHDGGPGLAPATFSEVRDLGLPGLSAFVGAVVGFAFGTTLVYPWQNVLMVLAGACFGFGLGNALDKRPSAAPGEPVAGDKEAAK